MAYRSAVQNPCRRLEQWVLNPLWCRAAAFLNVGLLITLLRFDLLLNSCTTAFSMKAVGLQWTLFRSPAGALHGPRSGGYYHVGVSRPGVQG